MGEIEVDQPDAGLQHRRIAPHRFRRNRPGAAPPGRAYGEAFIWRLRAMGNRDRPTAPRSPWQNAYAERLIGSIRREVIDHIVVLGERHLRHVLLSCMTYYNEARTHLPLNKDVPIPRKVQGVGRIFAKPHLGGLHHQYVRI